MVLMNLYYVAWYSSIYQFNSEKTAWYPKLKHKRIDCSASLQVAEVYNVTMTLKERQNEY